MASPEPFNVLAFVNHVAPGEGVPAAIEQALEWGVDVIVAQGTGSDWGPYWLGSGAELAVDLASNVRPYLRAAVEHRIPFVFSFGIAGADVHLERGLLMLDRLCAEEGWKLRLGVVSTEIAPERLALLVDEGRKMPRAQDVPDLSEHLSADEARALTRAVGLVGPEPLVDLLEAGVDGIVTGRALDIALFMAPAMARGHSRAVAGHLGKLLECAGFALEPGDSTQPVWAHVDERGIEVRSPNPKYRPSVRSLAAHSFYERSDPTKEDNPGGCLDLGEARYEVLEHGAVRCTGARWIDAPYTVLVEGAKLSGYRSLVLMSARDPALLDQFDAWIAGMRSNVAAAGRFASMEEGRDFHITVRQYGLPGAADGREAAQLGHEVGIVLDVVAPTQELANEIAYFAFIRLFVGPYPGRKTTAGNTAVPFMPLVIPHGPVYTFGAYHLLPLDDPAEVFSTYELTLPRGEP